MPKAGEYCLIFCGLVTACGQESRRNQWDREAARLESQIVPATAVDTYLRDHVGFTSAGGELRCSHLPLGADSARTVLYVFAHCREFPPAESGANRGSGLAWPLVLHLERSSGATRIVSHDEPRMGSLNRPDQERLFPAEVRSHPIFNNSSSAAKPYRDSLLRAVGTGESNLR